MPPTMPPPSDSDSDDDDDDSASDGTAVHNLLARVAELKLSGNTKFKAGEHEAAIADYEAGTGSLTSEAAKKALKHYFTTHHDAEDTASPLLASLHGNLAACHVKLEAWERASTAASAALKLEPSNVKARFRRGVAYSKCGQLDEAKADLSAVIRSDPKNREARAVLETVLTALKQRASSEKAMFGKAFAGPSLYADEAAKAAKAAEAAEVARAAEEAALFQEWRDECDSLRKRGPPNAAAELLSEAARAGDVEARLSLDRIAPLSLQEFGEAKLKAAAKEKARREKEAAEAQAKAAEAQAKARVAKSDVTTLVADDDDEAELLKGLSKGYKTRADGSKTSYFDRSEQVDAKTRALLEAQKAPKRIDVTERDAAAPAAVSSAPAPSTNGSVWNVGGTFEERDVSSWALADLRARLEAIRAPVAGGDVRVDRVADLEGTASIISNRGKVKRPFEFKCELTWAFAAQDPAHACEGQISYAEISPAPPSAAAAATYEQTERFVRRPSGGIDEGVKAARAELQRCVDDAMRGFVQALASR